jgi:hypothetical protein
MQGNQVKCWSDQTEEYKCWIVLASFGVLTSKETYFRRSHHLHFEFTGKLLSRHLETDIWILERTQMATKVKNKSYVILL